MIQASAGFFVYFVILAENGFFARQTVRPEKSLGLTGCERLGGQLWSGVDIQGQEGPRVHLPYRLLRVNCHRPVGGSHHLQNKEELRVPAGYVELVHELWSRF